MHRNENFRKVVKVFIVTFLCSELQSNLKLPTEKITPANYAYTAELNATYATVDASKHHVSIRLAALDDNFGEGHICSGALIAPSAVLTAAQCVFNYVRNFKRHPAELKVVMGTQNRYQRMQETLVYSVTHLYIPSTFDSQTLRDNIAILMLERDIFEHTHIKPITIGLDSANITFSADSKVTSWASTRKGEPVPSLMLLNASIANNKECFHTYGNMFAERMVCVNLMNVKQSQCFYDVGAPLLVDGKLMGLSSFGNNCAAKNSAGIYVDVRKHSEWIKQQIGDGTSQNSSIWGTIGFLLFTAFAIRTANFKKRRNFADL